MKCKYCGKDVSKCVDLKGNQIPACRDHFLNYMDELEEREGIDTILERKGWDSFQLILRKDETKYHE